MKRWASAGRAPAGRAPARRAPARPWAPVCCWALAITLALGASGCGSILSWSAGQVPQAAAYHPRTDLLFSGVRTDGDFLLHDPTILFKVLAGLDLPFSFVFDVVALPVTGVLRLFAEREWYRLEEGELANLAESHEEPEVRAGAQAELERRQRAR